MRTTARSLVLGESGIATMQYALMIGLIALASIVVWDALGGYLNNTFYALATDSLNAINTGAGGK